MDRALKSLTPGQVARYHADGGLAPIAVLSADEVAGYRASLERFERDAGTPIMRHPDRPTIWSKPHLLFTWVDAIVRHPAVLDVVEDIVGPNIRVFHTNIFVKEPHSAEFITWHQDGAYNGVSPPEVFTTWVALSAATPEMGCMRMLKGSHRHGLRVHVDKKSPGNLLSRGQQIETLENAEVIDLALQPGEMSIHHSYAVHSSEPNRSSERRIGVMTTYVPTHCRYVGSGTARMRAALVRGCDEYGHFDDDPRPLTDFGAAERAAHRASCERYIANVTSTENRQLPHAVTVGA
jgi:non-haem Fe2+, alpha-ketoglutarate-dependent halogenase